MYKFQQGVKIDFLFCWGGYFTGLSDAPFPYPLVTALIFFMMISFPKYPCSRFLICFFQVRDIFIFRTVYILSLLLLLNVGFLRLLYKPTNNKILVHLPCIVKFGSLWISRLKLKAKKIKHLECLPTLRAIIKKITKF